MKFSFYKQPLAKDPIAPADITLERAIFRIRNTYKSEIEKIRKNKHDKSLYSVLKKNLPGFTFSGIFPAKRAAATLIKHSGIICIDFDLNTLHEHPDYPKDATKKIQVTEFNIQNVKYRLSCDKYSLAVFVSPGGEGVKVLVKINPDLHLQSFNALQQYYADRHGLTTPFFDEACKDVSRLCFMSYDPELYYNLESEIFVPEEIPTEDPQYKIDTTTGEVIQVTPDSSWSRELQKQFDRAIQVVRRIEEKKVDVTGQYDDWVTIGLSLALFGEKGRELYHRVSQFHPEYKATQADYKFNDYLKNGRFNTPAKFFAVAKEYGIDTRIVREIASANAQNSEGKEYENWNYIFPSNVSPSNEMKQHVNQYGFFEYENKYYHALYDVKGHTVTFDESSNYVIHPLFLIVSRSEPKRIIEIENVYNVRKLVEIPANAFVSLSEFNAFVEGQGNFLNEFDKKQFFKVKRKIYNETKNALEIRTLGYSRDGFYAFSNGIFDQEFIPADDYGIVERSGNYYFLPALSSIYKDEEDDFQTHKKFMYKKSKVKYEEWSTQFCRMHKDNGKIGLLYFISALFRDVIFDRFRYFPHLFLFGPPGTGKSQMGISITSMFGQPLQPFLLTSGTPVAFHKRFAEFRNAVVWFDEYRNSIDPKRVQALKGAYDGSAHEKSENTSANRTKTTPVNSGCILSGQELPVVDNAMFKRVILLQYYQTIFSEAERLERMKLIEMEKAGLSYITAHITKLRPLVEANYHELYEQTIKEFKRELDKNDEIEERIIQNMCVLVSMFRTLKDTLKFPFSDEELKALAIRNIIEQNNLIVASKETSTFWSMVEYMLEKHDIQEGEDFIVKHLNEISTTDGKKDLGKTKEVLYLKLSKIHPLYRKYYREQNNEIGMDLGSLRHYLKNTPPFLGFVDQVRFKNSKTSALIFDYDMLKRSGINLDRGDQVENDATPYVPRFPKNDVQDTQNTEETGDLPF